MTAKLIDGKEIAKKIREGIKKEVSAMAKKPGLAAIIVGENPASKIYVGIKRRTCDEVGIYSEEHKLPEKTSEEELLELIRKLNADDKIHAILLQLPVPNHINSEKALSAIALEKDVDGFSPVNIGRLVSGNESFVPCTPKGIIRLLEETGIEIEGKNAVVVGRSNIVGKPTASMLLNRNATVTVCHSRTKNLGKITKQADILVVAVGKANMITKDMVKEGAVVIDVGMNDVDGKLTGDVDFENVKEKASWITPVPGGVGPMTVAMLLENTVKIYNEIEIK
ncbi:bifunctional methylenetetrahydrofolate dehydrogenase/methenyltetrahydrofolate cyclohydrolase FolD [Candidatus Woesearchaeota archaeon]|nr:bifunctional methylenetetrahydrofolate dehydrogenase/methenyltetrahydrofolate cyclohydrolase FolD [Candidatus Woesearchaeota archaeon]